MRPQSALDEETYDFSSFSTQDCDALQEAFVHLCRRKEPASFAQCALLCRTRMLEVMRREDEVLQQVHAHMHRLRDEWRSTADFIRWRFFQAEKKTDSETGRLWTEPFLADEPVRFVWSKNDFPYRLADGIEHCLLWMSRPLQGDDVDAVIESEIRRHTRFPFCWAFQKPAYQTVPSVAHAQVFVDTQSN